MNFILIHMAALAYTAIALLCAWLALGFAVYLRMRLHNRRWRKHKVREQALLAEHKPPTGFVKLAWPHEIINGPEFVIYMPGMQHPKPWDNWLLCGGRGENFRCRPTDIIFKRTH